MRRKLKSEPGIDEKKLSWTFSIVLFWQEVYSLSLCGPVRGFRWFRWDGRLLQTSQFYTPVGDVTNNVDGYVTSTIPEGQALRKKYLILTVTYKISCDELWMGIKWIYFTWLRVSQNEGWHRRVSCIKVRFMIPPQTAKKKRSLISFSHVFLCHSAAMLKVRYRFNWNPPQQCSAIQPHSELWVCACCCSLFIAGIGRTLFHTFRTLPGPLLLVFIFCLSLPFCHSVFHQCTRWCKTEWGHGRWSGNLLSAPCSPPWTTQAPDLLSGRLWTQKKWVTWCCVCAHVCSLYFLLCCMWCNCGR